MNCDRAKDLFSEYLEGSADYAQTAAVRIHVEECASCKRELQSLQRTWDVLDATPEVEPPHSFRHDVVMRVAKQQFEKAQQTRQGRWGLSWDLLFGRLLPARAIGIAVAGAALAIVLLNLPESALRYVAGYMSPAGSGSQVSEHQATTDSMESPLSQLGTGRKLEWQSRILGRNTVWVSVNRKDNEDGRLFYQVLLSINMKALPPRESTHRIGAKIYLLKGGSFNPEHTESAVIWWQGSILSDSPVLLPVNVDQRPEVFLVTWTFRQRDFAQIVYLPPRTALSGSDILNFSPGSRGYADDSLYPALYKVAQDYGVPIIANARLDESPSTVNLRQASLDATLRSLLIPIELDWLSADEAIYVDREYDISR